jgi:hypothetical protein
MLGIFMKRVFSENHIIAAIILIGGLFLFLDWYRVLHHTMINISPYDISRILKRIASAMVLVLVLISRDRSVSASDHRRLTVIFVMIFAGDLLLLFNINRAGIALFFATQILLVIRNLSGIRSFLSSRGKQMSKAVLIFCAVALLDFIVIRFVFKPLLAGNTMFGFIAAYSAVLSLSLYAALLAPLIGFFEMRSALFVATGMICFFLCDLTVGLRISFSDDFLRTIVTSLTWVFYLPALLLIALSGNRRAEKNAAVD